MGFDRKSAEYLVDRMISWTRGVSSKLTDFRVGSKIRTLYEAVAILIEEKYDKMFRAMRQLITDSMYSMLSFDKIPAAYASGLATFSRTTPATQNYFIQAGTTLTSQASAFSAPLKFYTTADAVLATGATSVDVPVICSVSGIQGNIPARTLTTFVQKPVGIDAVTNGLDFINGLDIETTAAQKIRFQEFIEAQTRGVLQSIEYGAKLATVVDITGASTERVLQAVAIEDLPARKGEVDLYVWNGVGTASSGLQTNITKILLGYYNSDGTPVYGYKSAGILVNIYSTPIKYVKIKIEATAETWSTIDSLKTSIEGEISRYFTSLVFGQTVVQAALEANIKAISGIYDIKLYFSLDNGVTYTMDNVVVDPMQLALPVTPYTYV